MEKMLSKYKGCLLGGAIGDALGYPVEFMKLEDIHAEYGENGIEEFRLYKDKALISDDTQMTMFTACGLLKGYTRFAIRGIMGDWAAYVYLSYMDWMITQFNNYGCPISTGTSWLLNLPDLYSCRAPGNTCLNALETHRCGRIYSPLNNSKGCGGVMRVAPVGLYLSKHAKDQREIAQIGAEVAAITHGNPLGYMPAAAFAYIIAKCIEGKLPLKAIVEESIEICRELFSDKEEISELCQKIELAISLAESDEKENDAIAALGEGFTAHEALAIAVYCSLRFSDDFVKGIRTAVNHDGDSDSTGAITGNILGAYLGMEQIPGKFMDKLEFSDVIEMLAADMFRDCQLTEDGNYRDQDWVDKYIYGTYGREDI